jgi:hypothetical protein
MTPQKASASGRLESAILSASRLSPRSNSHRVENDLKDRIQRKPPVARGTDSGRLTAALHSAERRLTAASEKEHLSETEVHATLSRLAALQTELATLTP